LTHTVQTLRPRLLILDPLIRLHRVDENDASQIAALLSYLRELQRQFQLAVLLVHHARKDAHSARPGQALRGSSELHGWGDSNLYMRRRGDQLTLTTEHRAAPSQDHLPLQLTQSDKALALALVKAPALAAAPGEPSPLEKVRQTLAQLQAPVTGQELRKLCAMRTATLGDCLDQLQQRHELVHTAQGYQLRPTRHTPTVSLSAPIHPPGNGNGKTAEEPQLSFSLCSSGG
jgi:hypothetical protein